MFRITLALASLVWICQGSKIEDCPTHAGVSYFLADGTDPCVYHWCLNGELMMDKPFECPAGTGVPEGYRGTEGPCTDVRPACMGTTTASPPQDQGKAQERVTEKKDENKAAIVEENKGGKHDGLGVKLVIRVTDKTVDKKSVKEPLKEGKVKLVRGKPEGKSWGWNYPSGYSNYGNVFQPAAAPAPAPAPALNAYGYAPAPALNRYGYAPAPAPAAPAAQGYGYAAAPAYHHQPYYNQHHVYVNVQETLTTTTPAVITTTTPTATSTTTTTSATPLTTATPVQVNIPYGYGGLSPHGFGFGGTHSIGGGQYGGGSGYFAATAWLTKNANLPGGTLQPHVHSLKFCWKACVHSLDCKGFDYDIHQGTCWLHTTTTICNTLLANTKVHNYRLVHCASTTGSSLVTTTASGPIPSTTPAFTSGQHIMGGVLQTNILSRASCLSSCASFAQMTCSGVDWSTTGSMCFFHSNLTECNPLTAMAGTEHYRFINCAPTTPCTSASFTPYPVSHVLGGTLQAGIGTQAACQTACCNSAACAGYDFNSGDMSCWFHSATSCSGNIIAKANCLHFSRTGSCPSAPVIG